ncbi:hypothetical protein NDU88_008171 [Pleurodeles waltl]|uniref:Secreted protein n=1 Tax=Pleurodeles waltl TaxID=8319 RepID=A0AAV7VRS9_PLEWA|nr:hypothetical protein NDU88_008171 [Pleurodeles waltl]
MFQALKPLALSSALASTPSRVCPISTPHQERESRVLTPPRSPHLSGVAPDSQWPPRLSMAAIEGGCTLVGSSTIAGFRVTISLELLRLCS